MQELRKVLLAPPAAVEVLLVREAGVFGRASVANGVVAFGLPLLAARSLHGLHSTVVSGRAGMRLSPPFLITGSLRLRCHNRGGLAAAKSLPFTLQRPKQPPAFSTSELLLCSCTRPDHPEGHRECIGLVVHDPCRPARGARHHNGNWSRPSSRSITATTPCARFALHALANVLPLSSRWRCG